VHHQLSHKPEVFSGSSIWLCWSSPVGAGPISTAELSWAHRCFPAGLKWLVTFKHSSPDMVVQRVAVRQVRRPFIFTNEFTAVGSNPVLSQLCRVYRRAVLLKDEARRHNRSAILNKFRQQNFNMKFSIHFGLVWNEMHSSVFTETDASRNHDVLGELCSLNYQPTFIDVSLLTRRPYTIILMVHRRIQISFFSSVKKTVIAFASFKILKFWQTNLTRLLRKCILSDEVF